MQEHGNPHIFGPWSKQTFEGVFQPGAVQRQTKIRMVGGISIAAMNIETDEVRHPKLEKNPKWRNSCEICEIIMKTVNYCR